MNELDDFPCTGEPAVPSVATVIGIPKSLRRLFEDGGLCVAQVQRNQIVVVDFYATPPGALGGN